MSLTPPPNMTDPALIGNRRQAGRDRAAIRASLDAWPPHPTIECGYTAPDGRRWIHIPWKGWRPDDDPPFVSTRRTRKRRWWPW